MKKNAFLSIIQPNYRLSYKEYFDDYTHISIWSDKSLADFLVAQGFKIHKVIPGFLPLSVKSRLPVNSYLIRLYLKAPIKPFAKQMLIMAQNQAYFSFMCAELSSGTAGCLRSCMSLDDYKERTISKSCIRTISSVLGLYVTGRIRF